MAGQVGGRCILLCLNNVFLTFLWGLPALPAGATMSESRAGRYVAQLFGTDAGQRMRNHMDMVVDCHISMWNGTMVVAPDDQ